MLTRPSWTQGTFSCSTPHPSTPAVRGPWRQQPSTVSSLQFTQTGRGEGCTSGSQDDWRPPCNEDSISPMFPIVSGRALIGQDRVTCSPTEPMSSHPHPTSWTDYGEGVVLRENEVLLPEEGVAMWQGKAAEHLLPLSSKLRLCGHLLNPHL